MRVAGYCPNCGKKAEHMLARNGKHYYCLGCGCKEKRKELEDIWWTFNLTNNG